MRDEEAGRTAWKEPVKGRCEGCGRRGRLVRHHVVYEQHVRAERGDPWELSNAMLLGVFCDCHRKHHESGPARRPLPLAKVPDAALVFAVDLMGEDRAAEYFRRYYGGERRTSATTQR
jgi:5-methylcytosine-specific restriction endonuclease McrA